jgi:hypothetical protein
MQRILEEFEMTTECNNSIDTYIKKYYNGEMPDYEMQEFPYLENLDKTITHYAQFGADKCSITNFPAWCTELNVDIYEHLTQFVTESRTKRYHFYSRDKKLTFTCFILDFDTKGVNCYIHYLGVTGEKECVIRAFESFCKHGKHTGMSWGNRDFV